MLVTKPSEQRYLDKSLYSETSPLGNLYSKDTSIQGTQNTVPEKCSHNLNSIEGTLRPEKEHILWVPWV